MSGGAVLSRRECTRRRMLYALLAAVLLASDVLSKCWAVEVLAPLGEMPLIDGLIGLRYARNFGAAFSSFSGATLMLSAVSLIVCTGAAWYLMKNIGMHPLAGVSLTMIFAGGIGNLIDRVTRGYVVDFFEFQFIEFAIFNVADVFITVGAGLLFIALMLGGEEA